MVKNINAIMVNGIPLLINIDYIVDFLNGMNQKEITMHAFNMASLITHNYNAYDYRKDIDKDIEVHDIFKLINIYGYGVCKQFTLIMCYLLDIFNIKNNVLYLGKNTKGCIDHFAIEVFYNDKWHYFDPNLKLYFTLNDEIVSTKEIQQKKYDAIIGDFTAKIWLNFNKNLEYLYDVKKFRKLYLEMFNKIEIFTLNDIRYDYKKKLLTKKAISKWYSYNEKCYFIQDNVEVSVNYNGYGILNYSKVLSNSDISFKNLIFNFKFYNSNKIIINYFPFILLDCILNFNEEYVNLKVSINGQTYYLEYYSNDSLFDNICKENDIYINPIYSIEIEVENKIKEYKLIVQSSNFIDKLYSYIEKEKKKGT